MSRPFRFGVQIHHLPTGDWRERVRRIEALGYSTIFLPDHFSDQWEPASALGAFAAVTERLNVGTLVYDVDYRHPVVLAKSSATLHAISDGRHEFGIGAGWMETDYRQAGIPYDPPGVRIDRLDEALAVIRSMWENERTSFDGEHYRIAEIAWSVNDRTENIGARRLHTVMERLLEHVSFGAADKGGSSIDIDAAFVDRHLGELVKDEDLSRYIL